VTARSSERPDRLSAALALYQLLDACAKERLDVPKGTGQIKVDTALCRHLSRVLAVDGEPVNVRTVWQAFGRLPVKQAHGVIKGTVLKIEEIEERDLMLKRYGAKHRRRG